MDCTSEWYSWVAYKMAPSQLPWPHFYVNLPPPFAAASTSQRNTDRNTAFTRQNKSNVPGQRLKSQCATQITITTALSRAHQKLARASAVTRALSTRASCAASARSFATEDGAAEMVASRHSCRALDGSWPYPRRRRRRFGVILGRVMVPPCSPWPHL